MTKQKTSGQVFTPAYLVGDILDAAGYVGTGILGRHVIDNSCGNGAFLSEIVKRYTSALRLGGCDDSTLKSHLATYIHGIEIDDEAYADCLRHLRSLESELHLPHIDWDVIHADALATTRYYGKMNYVVGNPPYIRVHNLGDKYGEVKGFAFAEGGMTDIYLVFFEAGMRMLAEGGRLCYITPSSWLTSVAGTRMRQAIMRNRNLAKLIDLGHYQPFDGATAYTIISLFEKGVRHDSISFSTYGGPADIAHVAELPLRETFIQGKMYLGTARQLETLRTIRESYSAPYAKVKNGFATLADDIFIRDSFSFSEYVIPTIKASTGKWRKAFYPYDKNGKPISLETLCADEKIAAYLRESKADLLKGKSEKQKPDWYLYGRTQALKDVWTDKFAVNSIVRDASSVKINLAPNGTGVYGGLYVLTAIDEDTLRTALQSGNFTDYLKMLRGYKSGGYYTFSSHDLELFLNYQIPITNQSNGNENEPRIPDGYLPFF